MAKGYRIRGDFIASLIKQHDCKIGYEIGVSNGATFGKILKKCDNIEWHGVDPWVVCSEYDKRPNGKGKWNHDGNYEKVQEIVSKYPKRAYTHRMTSVEAAKEVEDRSIDIIFIDGLHTYEGVKEDLEAWVPKIKIGGIISGHDYKGMKRHEGVTIRVNEVFGEENITTGPDVTWWLYKTEEHDD
ncbi:hypothetical protein Syn7803C34_27 [Synechococcus phage ACG-2014f]|uniref:Methyltransferase n=1 Tax=Synechococcus phage ACG-2014f TaxID=1493511 RepID=A0A0E3I7R1_9CAUD|nr:hypothetical protein Syn7803C6_27 [Synechococcus phage ACG-2014f]AIX29923.1 hypothetical protein Syn7803US34_28 [Synechococcus phage ACG-2014f]AIX30504.1 hypothetical protein Syn7803US37_27 [Synechococcus phage ACG-2014f]AIX30798.1 hypothetical protein Syn7803US39_27 [Synechococcus phage ACG-2014f]AIX42246.1 hypothetical protein Syn7803C16_27 [Synechococcus phage ACG-2014f]